MGEPDDRDLRQELTALLQARDAPSRERKKRLFAIAASLAYGRVTPDDLVQTACVKTLGGNTAWNRAVHPDLVTHLGSVMAATRSNGLTSADARRQRHFHEDGEEDRVRDGGDGAEQRLLDDEAERRAARKLGKWIGALRVDRKQDRESTRLIDCFEQGQLTAAEQVVATGWSIGDVRRVRKRLFERAELVMKKNPDDSGPFPLQPQPPRPSDDGRGQEEAS